MRPEYAFLVGLSVLVLAAPDPLAAQKLDNDDKKWLGEVEPILLSAEEKTYRGLKKKADRQEFRAIFWARRDPNLETPGNEFETEFRAARAEADQRFRVSAKGGADTDCGRVFILLGAPDDVRKDPVTETRGPRVPETWTYLDRPGQTFQGGKAVISFDAECRAPLGVAAQLEQVAAARVLHPNIDYRFDKDGGLVKLADLLPKDTPARALIKAPRQDFPVAAQVSYLKVADGSTGLLGLIRGEDAGLAAEERGGRRLAELVVAASAVAEDGKEAGWTEQKVAGEVAADGSFVASFKLGLRPGRYTLKAGALDPKSGRGSLASQPIEVPDYDLVATAEDGTVSKVPSIASLIVLRDVEEVPAGTTDPHHPYAAFEIGAARLVPFFGQSFRKTDAVSFFYQVYDLGVDATTGKADGVTELRILRDGKTVVAKAPEARIEATVGGSVIGPVPLASYTPGRYVVELKLSDRVSKKDLVERTSFEIQP
jgi:GWxTD domain-containing protein